MPSFLSVCSFHSFQMTIELSSRSEYLRDVAEGVVESCSSPQPSGMVRTLLKAGVLRTETPIVEVNPGLTPYFGWEVLQDLAEGEIVFTHWLHDALRVHQMAYKTLKDRSRSFTRESWVLEDLQREPDLLAGKTAVLYDPPALFLSHGPKSETIERMVANLLCGDPRHLCIYQSGSKECLDVALENLGVNYKRAPLSRGSLARDHVYWL